MMVTIQMIGFCWLLSSGLAPKDIVKRLATQAGTPFLSILLVAPVWFPIASFLTTGDLVSSYTDRRIFTQDIDNLLSAFTSKHYWETYLGYKPMDWLKANDIKLNNVMIPHLGISVAIVTGFGFLLGKKHRILSLLSMFTLVGIYARYFNVWPFIDMAYWPIINSISPQYFGAMIGLLFTFCFSISFSNILNSHKKLSAFGLIIAVLIIYAFLHLFFKLGWPQEVDLQRYLFVGILLFSVTLICFLLFWFSGNRTVQNVIKCTLFFLVVTELFYYINHYRPVRYDAFVDPPKEIQFLKDNIGDGRVFSIGSSRVLVPEFGAAYGIKQVGTRTSSVLPWYRTFYENSFGNDNALFVTLDNYLSIRGRTIVPSNSKDALNLESLNFMAVKYVMTNTLGSEYRNFLISHGWIPVSPQRNKTYILENPLALKNAFFVNDVYKGIAPFFNEEKSVFESASLESASLINKMKDAKERPSNEKINKVKSSNTSITYEVFTDAPALLVTNEVWHKNWKARLNGETIETFRVNGAFRGYYIPKGKHTLEENYILLPYYYGCYVLLFVLGILLFYGLWYFFLRKRVIDKVFITTDKEGSVT